MTIIKKFETEKEDKNGFWKTKKLTIPLMVFMAFLIITEIWVTHTVSTYSEKFNNIEKLQQSLSIENQILETKIEAEGSLSNIASASATLGFSKPENIQYIR